MNEFDAARPPAERRSEERLLVRLKGEIKEIGPAEIQEMFPDSGRFESFFLPLTQVQVLNLSSTGLMVGSGEELGQNRLLALALHLPSQHPVYALVQSAWSSRQHAGQQGCLTGLRFMAIKPGHARARFHLGLMKLKKGDQAGAREALKKALEVDPDNPKIKDALARIK